MLLVSAPLAQRWLPISVSRLSEAWADRYGEASRFVTAIAGKLGPVWDSRSHSRTVSDPCLPYRASLSCPYNARAAASLEDLMLEVRAYLAYHRCPHAASGEIDVAVSTVTLERALQCHESIPPGGYAVISVADNGPGKNRVKRVPRPTSLVPEKRPASFP